MRWGTMTDRNAVELVLCAVSIWCTVVLTAGCLRTDDSHNTSVTSGGRRSRLMNAIASHRGDKAMVFWMEYKMPGRVARLVDFSASQERTIHGMRFYSVGTWSPDDRFFAAVRALGEGEGRTELGIIEVSTLRWRAIQSEMWSMWPVWSADGAYIMFEAVVDARDFYRVYLYSMHTRQCMEIAVGGIFHCRENPFWGDRFVFSRRASDPEDPFRGLDRWRFFCRLIDPFKGRDQREMLPEQFVDQISVSPTGNAAIALCWPRGVQQDAELRQKGYTMYLITDPTHPQARKLCTGRFECTRWSQHGDRIVVCLTEQVKGSEMRRYRLAIIDITTGSVTPISDNQGRAVYGVFPQWVDEDKHILYGRRSPTGAREIWRYTLSSKVTSRLYPFDNTR